MKTYSFNIQLRLLPKTRPGNPAIVRAHEDTRVWESKLACLGVTCSAVLTEVAFQFFLALFSSF